MTAIEIKELRKEVKQYIDLADNRMLKVIRAMLEADQEKDIETVDDWANDINEDEKAAINRGLKQLDKGEGIPHNEAVKQLKWFPK